jgi:AcrR family transcriptional regulator
MGAVTESLRERKKERTRRAIADAGLALIARDGYAATTIAGIADAADVSRRTVFRHFADKEELVFADDGEHREAILAAVAAAAAGTPALDVVRLAGHAFAASLEGRRSQLPAWLRVVAAEPALQARRLAKQRRWEALVADGLVARGTDPPRARLAASVGIACVQAAFDEWSADPAEPFSPRVDAAFAALRELCADAGGG